MAGTVAAMLSSAIVGHEGLDALANHPNKPLGSICIAVHRGFSERGICASNPRLL